jgi:hypothetical protein
MDCSPFRVPIDSTFPKSRLIQFLFVLRGFFGTHITRHLGNVVTSLGF